MCMIYQLATEGKRKSSGKSAKCLATKGWRLVQRGQGLHGLRKNSTYTRMQILA